jgi:hypothetical protein
VPDRSSEPDRESAGRGEPRPDLDPGVALERGDDLVQQLAIAKYALVAGDTEQAMGAIDAALTTSRESLTELADPSVLAAHAGHAGAFVRSAATGAVPPQPVVPDLPAEPA